MLLHVVRTSARPSSVAPRRLASTVRPEGGISPDGTIGEFKDGAFIIAVASQVPIVPVAIHGSRLIWPPGRNTVHSGQVHIVIGSPLPTTGLNQDDIPRLRDQARNAICAAHRDLTAARPTGKAAPEGAPN